MPQMTPSGARIIDPVLSTIAQGYKNSEMVAGALFPQVPVMQRGGNVITFGKEGFMLYASARAPGEATRRVQFGYAGAPYALVDYSLEGVVPVEIDQEAASIGIDVSARTVMGVQDIMALRLEKQAADIARTAGSYAAGNKVTLTTTLQWSDHTAGLSLPYKNVETAKEAVRAATGKRPNTIVMGAQVMAALRQHPHTLDRMKYTGRDVATAEILASLFGVERVLVGDAIYATDAGVFADVWGKDVVIAYTNTATLADAGAPSYGYTYNLGGYPLVEVPYVDRNAKSAIYPVTRSEAPVLASAAAGYLITNAVA